MKEYIEREAALDIVNGWREQLIPTYGKNDEYVKCLETVAEHLELLHAADVVPVRHGRWIEYPECLGYEGAYSEDHIVCSACGMVFNLLDNCTETFNYCPHCGARMDGDGDGTIN